jgi:hypothetical protein
MGMAVIGTKTGRRPTELPMINRDPAGLLFLVAVIVALVLLALSFGNRWLIQDLPTGTPIT